MQPRLNIKDHKGLEHFKRLARKAYPEEYTQAVLGTLDLQEVNVEKFVEIKYETGKDTEGSVWCQVTHEDWQTCSEAAKADGLTLLGSIHSHPRCISENDSVSSLPSAWDNVAALEYGEHIIAIYTIQEVAGARRRGKVIWYLPQHPIEPTA